MPAAPLFVRGGQPVPPCEVEQFLLGHPAVAEAVVAGVDPIDLFRPRPATEDLRIPRQVRRS